MPYKDKEKQRVAHNAANKRYGTSQKRKETQAKYDRQPHIKAKGRERARRWIADNPEKVSERNRRYAPIRVAVLLAQQEAVAGRRVPDRCDACGNPPGKRRLHFDHCHMNGWFRGWLCSPCNQALGLMKDDANRLRKLIAYLKRTKNGTGAQLTLSGI
jgi:hypothetical protein